MHKTLHIALAQLNFLLGDIQGNTQKIVAAAKQARDALQADLIIYPELTITAYPPEDLLLRPHLYPLIEQALHIIQQQVQGIHLVVGHPAKDDNGIYNAASVIYNGQILGTYYKQHLPNYSVFDEKRYFQPGSKPLVIPIQGIHFGITICEDLWLPGTLQQAKANGAQAIISLNASPFHLKKPQERLATLQWQQQQTPLPIIYVNLVGGQDELVFDGGSLILDATGEVVHQSIFYQEALDLVTLTHNKTLSIKGQLPSPADPFEKKLYQTLVLGTRDYLRKNNFPGAIVGLSGGIDSALTLTIACDAVGPENVHAVLMPSRYTADISIEDATKLANNLKIKSSIISIEPAFNAFLAMLNDEFANLPEDTTEENIQARCRGIILMALSNKTGKLVLTTGNKSEMAVGYATLYGDMAGGFAVLKDVSKTLVYALAQYRNQIKAVIPNRIITRPPSAELKLQQTDQDSLPPYDVLDPIMQLYVEGDHSIEKIVAKGFEETIVRQIIRLIDRNEYKRRQAPPGVRISPRAFGRDWRFPITSDFWRNQ